MPDDLTDRLERISLQLDSLETAVRENRAGLTELERVAGLSEDNQAGGHRRNLAIIGGFVVMVIIIFAGYRSNSDRTDGNSKAITVAQEAIDAANASRADARLSGCRAYNTDVADRINAILTGLAATSKDSAAAEQLVAGFLLPRRVCTPDGLAAYFATPQGPGAYETTTTTVPGG